MGVLDQVVKARGPGWLGVWAGLAAHARGLAPAPEPTDAWWAAARAALAPSGTALLDGPTPPSLAFRLVALAPFAQAAAADPGLLGDAYAATAPDNPQAGRFYTPPAVVQAAFERPLAAGDRVVDPACGGGRFLLGALAAQPRARLDGLDVDAHAASVCRAALWIAADGQAPARIQVADPLADRALGGSGLPPGRFQRVVGNPPYRAARRGPLLQGDPQGYRQHFQTAEYQLDPYVLFLELGLQALAPGGELAMVVPGAWAANHHTGKLRSLVVGQYRLAEWIELPLDTFAAGVETVLMRVVHDGRTGRRVPVRSLRGVPRGALLPDPERPRAPLALARTPEDEALLAHSRGWATTLGDVAEITRGVNPYHHSTHSPAEIEAKVHHAAVPRTPAWEPELRGRDLAGPYRLWPGGEHWIRYGPWLKEPRDPRFHEGPRLLVRKVLGPTLCAVFLARRYVCDQSLYVVKPRPGQPWPLGALLACLNSSLLARLLRARHQADDEVFPQLKVAELRTLPLPPVAPTDPAVQALHQAALATLLLEGVHGAALAAEAGDGPGAADRRRALRRSGWPTRWPDKARAAELERRRAALDAAVERLYLGAPALVDAPTIPDP